MNGVSKTKTAQGVMLLALVALCLGIGSARAAFPAANGKLAFVNGGQVGTVNSDGSNLLTGLCAGAHPSFSPNGTKLAFDDGTTLFTANADCSGAVALPGPTLGTEPAWIDSSTLVFTTPGPNSQIDKVDIGTGTLTPLSQSASSTNQDPAVSPSGATIAFASDRTGHFEIWVMSASGSGQCQTSGGGTSANTDPTWSPDGTHVAFVSNRDGNQEIYSTPGTCPAGGDLRLTTTAVNNAQPAYSPDGTLIAISSAGILTTVPSSGGPLTPVPGNVAGTDPEWQDAAPVNISAPAISPTTPPFQGGTLTASVGTWSGSPTGFAYQWLRCDGLGGNCNPIGGATGPSYVVQSVDVGSGVSLAVQVTATNIAGSTAAQSAPAGHASASWPVNITTPQLFGTPKAFPLGTSVSGNTGLWTGIQPITYTFQWQYCDWLNPPQCAPIPFATSSSYAPSGDYIGFRLRLVIKAMNSAGSDTAMTGLSATVTGDLPFNTVSPKILAGSIEVGSTLTTDTGTFTGATPLHFTYQWMKCQPVGQPCTAIPGATASSYILQLSDKGATIRSQVTAANGGGSNYGTSNHTLPILPKTRFGPANSDPPALQGKPVVGSTLVGDPGSWTGEAPIRYTYTWLHCDATGQDCTAIPNHASTTYKLKLADSGYTIKMLVTGRNVLGAATVNSDPTDVITQLPPAPKGKTINGTSKNDYLGGSAGNDTINGKGGNDTIKGGGGDDTINGGDGNDVIDGGAGADHLNGGKGSDTIYAADGQRDWVDCGPGSDKALVDSIDVVKNCESISTPLASETTRR